MFYVRAFLIMIWVAVCCVAGVLMIPFHYGDLTMNRRMGRMIAWGIHRISGIRLEVEGFEKIAASRPCIYVANHQSMFDMSTFGAIIPDRAVVVGKREIIYFPLFGVFFLAAGNIAIDRKRRTRAVASLAKVVEQIREKRLSVWVFPEGTRNPAALPLLPFKKGAFHMAVQSGLPILPIVSSPLDAVYSWKDRRLKKGILRVRVLDPIESKTFGSNETDRLAAATHARMTEGVQTLMSPSRPG